MKMAPPSSFATLFGAPLPLPTLLLLLQVVPFGVAQSQGLRETTCRWDELSHSTLVECNAIQCGSKTNDRIWPDDSSEVIQIASSRSGNRFERRRLPNLNYYESDSQRLFDINTTLYVRTRVKQNNEIIGFGATLNTSKLLATTDQKAFERAYGQILSDLFAQSESRLALTIFRLPVEPGYVVGQNLSDLLQELDLRVAQLMKYDATKKPLKILLDLDKFDPQTLLDTMRNMANVTFQMSSIEIWALSVNVLDKVGEEALVEGELFESIRRTFSISLVLGSVRLRDAPAFLDRLPRNQTSFQGLLLKAEPSLPYEYLAHVRSLGHNLKILSIGSDKPATKYYGDWQSAQNYAAEIMNHLRYNSSAFIESLSAVEVLEETREDLDASIYSLHRSHMLHFRGPMYYALGHFTRHLLPGSQVLDDYEIFTQPNMFAGSYLAFKTADGGHIVAVVLNDNEHQMPFRLAVNQKIVAQTALESKSFNTFIVAESH